MKDLEILADHQDALLLAEAIGWLHDYRKCSDEILQGGGSPRPHLMNNVSSLSGIFLALPTLFQSVTIEDMLHEWKGKQNDPATTLLLRYISRCHKASHFDKQEPVAGAPDYPIVQVSSPFGFEKDIPIDLTNKLWSLPWNNLRHYPNNLRNSFRQAVRDLFSQTIADTRRPINEVDLWSWGLLVGTLYKAALAGAMLEGAAPAVNDLRWRLLGIQVNGFDFFLNVARIPDLLARRRLLSDGLDKVRNLLEVTYPLGCEVYRDENGSIHVVPDISDLLYRTDNNGVALRELILQAFEKGTLENNVSIQVGEEVSPQITLQETAWWGQDPDWPRSSNDEIPDIGSFLTRKIESKPEAEKVSIFWRNDEIKDICTVCGLRPKGPSRKADDRTICDTCERRRADHSREWATCQAGKTIWVDEVADENGRLALVAGQFDMTHWLDGGFIESLLLIAPNDPFNTNGKPVIEKSSSFSRLRRIWKTTHDFWQGIQADLQTLLSDDRRRLKIRLNGKPDLGPFHVYDLQINATDLNLVWVPPTDGGYFISADNLGYIADQLGAEESIYRDSAAAAIFVEDYLRDKYIKNDHEPILRNPDASSGMGKANLLLGMRIKEVEYQEVQYAVTIPILAEPRTFMALVPADKALDILKAIQLKYEREMGKVRNRLPLHLGAVYFHRRTPLRAALDAGRAMLQPRTFGTGDVWTVQADAMGGLLPDEKKALSDGGNHQFQKTISINLARNGNGFTWLIPAMMGDGSTEDNWYPYVFFRQDKDGNIEPADSRRTFKTNSGRWVVHASDLKARDRIEYLPSTFDFEFLDTTGRRFEIYYDKDGRRPSRPTRPFYLEDLDRFEVLWDALKPLTKTQRRQVIHSIEATRERWHGSDHERKSLEDKVFEQFVADALGGAAWPRGESPRAEADGDDVKTRRWKELVRAGVRGELADLAELHMELLKE